MGAESDVDLIYGENKGMPSRKVEREVADRRKKRNKDDPGYATRLLLAEERRIAEQQQELRNQAR